MCTIARSRALLAHFSNSHSPLSLLSSLSLVSFRLVSLLSHPLASSHCGDTDEQTQTYAVDIQSLFALFSHPPHHITSHSSVYILYSLFARFHSECLYVPVGTFVCLSLSGRLVLGTPLRIHVDEPSLVVCYEKFLTLVCLVECFAYKAIPSCFLLCFYLSCCFID